MHFLVLKVKSLLVIINGLVIRLGAQNAFIVYKQKFDCNS